MNSMKVSKAVAGVALVVLLIALPYTWWSVGGLLPGATGAASSLSMLSMVFVLAALAVTFDLLLGQSGLMSLGHALYFAVGAYSFTMMLAYTDLGFWVAAVLAIIGTAAASVVLNAIALKIEGIPYAMVTLAFAELASVIVARNYFGTGGESGLRVPSAKLPSFFVGLQNIHYVYWVCLAFAAVVVVIAAVLVRTEFGLALRGTRENALRMQILGYNVYGLRLVISIIASTLAGACGVFYVIALGGTDPETVGLTFALSLIFMVIIGGSGRIGGALLGGAIFALLSQRLPAVGEALADQQIPGVISDALSEPDLVLGVIFLIVVFLAPKGILGLVDTVSARAASRRSTGTRVAAAKE